MEFQTRNNMSGSMTKPTMYTHWVAKAPRFLHFAVLQLTCLWLQVHGVLISVLIQAAAWQNQQNDLCAQRRLRSAQSHKSSLCPQRVAKDPQFLHADIEDWSEFLLGAQVIFSSPELKALWWAYRIGRPPSAVRLSSTLFKTSQKSLGRLKPNFIWSFHGMGERKFVQTVIVTWPRWPHAHIWWKP